MDGAGTGSTPAPEVTLSNGSAVRAQELARLGAALAEDGQFTEAAAVFDRALAADPAAQTASACLEMLAQCRMALADDEGAYDAAAAAVAARPGWRPALLTLGRAARNAGRLREAAAALGSFVDTAPRPADAPEAGGLRNEAPASTAAAPAAAAAAVGQDGQPGSLDEEEEREAARELAEVQGLLQLQVGHQLGLPGLRLLERRGGAAGPGGVAWESGALLAWFLVQQAAGTGGGGGGGSGMGGCASSAANECGVCAPPARGDGHGTAGADGCARCVPTSSSARGAASAVTSTRDARSRGGTGTGGMLRGARVLELGAGGTGLVGLAAACLGAHVVATDLPAVLPQLQAAAALNAGMVDAAGGSMSVAALDWCQPGGDVLKPQGTADGQYSWLMGADLVYSLPPVAPLADTMAAAAAHAAATGAPPLKILLSHKHRHDDVDAALLTELRERGVALRAVLRDAGSRCTVYANDAAAAAIRAHGSAC